MEVNGTLIWYYNICKREVWLMSRNIIPDQNDDNIEIGKFIHENSYTRNQKEVQFGNVKFDVILKNKEKLIIGETKKSSKYEQASKYQLAYYLRVLNQSGIKAEGCLLYPEEKKRTEIKIDKDLNMQLDTMILDIEDVMENPIPPKPIKISFCKNCGYREYCYS